MAHITKEDLHNVQSTLTTLISDNFSKISTEIQELKKLQTTVENNSNQIAKIDEKLAAHDREIITLKRDMDRKNIIIHGLHKIAIRDDSIEDSVLDLCVDKLKINMSQDDIDFAYRLSKDNPQAPVKVGLTNTSIKNCILGNRKILKDLNLDVFISECLPKELRIRNAQLRKAKRANIEKDKNKRLLSQSPGEVNSPNAPISKKLHASQSERCTASKNFPKND